MISMETWPTIILVATLATLGSACKPSVTRVSGTHSPNNVCSGQLVFEDNFDELDLQTWQHEITLGGGGNWEFQWYTNNRSNSYTRDGILYIKPTLTSDDLGEGFLSSGTLNVDGGAPADRCTDARWFGCERTGSATNILNPIKSARIRTVQSFNFRYGRVEVRAQVPAGDWLWPAIWLMPTSSAYGTWPSSGEIDLMESRGNKNLYNNGVPIGTQETSSTLHYGPYPTLNAWDKAHWSRINADGYDTDFHRFQLEWTPEYIRFSVDDVELGTIRPPSGGFWSYGEFDSNRKIDNPWKYGTNMAPFDQSFYLIMNLAVGGTNYFPDSATNPIPKPWANNSPQASLDFWNGRSGWLPTWNLDVNNGEGAALKVDYVRVWAL